MQRSAIALHVIEKDGLEEKHLKCVNKTKNVWNTGFWKVSDATAKSLVGGCIYVHTGQKASSHIGGRVISFNSEDGGRKVFRFRAVKEMTNVFAGNAGWGNEKKVVWASTVVALKTLPSEDEESAYPEGSEAYRTHLVKERDPTLAARAKRKRLKETGNLKCEVCEFDFATEYGELGAGYIEAHHTTPVSKLDGTRKTKISELALVCSNCHRMLHRSNPLLDVESLRALISGET